MGEGATAMPSDFWTLIQQFGLPISMLLVFVWTIYKKIFVPGWYAFYLEEKLKTEEIKNDELTKKSFELASLARTAVDIGKAVIQKKESEQL